MTIDSSIELLYFRELIGKVKGYIPPIILEGQYCTFQHDLVPLVLYLAGIDFDFVVTGGRGQRDTHDLIVNRSIVV
ncbi:hypothetical protein SDC9_174838 [bioreactor metagenome]|uniref:Uncharacterized protein n=1 Tax=bioreactor metagenome TaxID=1076179 RepID=A0A645GMG8_9ZZZZ